MIDIFQYPNIDFPDDFLWGVATAGMQIEGDNCSYHDTDEASAFAYGGVPYQKAGKACNSYVQYEDDIQLLKDMNIKMYRMSLEWCRIEPIEGEFNEAALQHYQTILQRLKEENIKVCLSLHHMSHPVWFHQKDAFKTMDNIDAWNRYIETVSAYYKDDVDYWIVINEMNLAFEYSVEERMNMLRYHASGYHIIKKYSDRPVSSTLSYSMKEPYRGRYDTSDRIMADYIDYSENEFFIHAIQTGEIVMPFHDAILLPEVKDTCDFWALNTYIRQFINARKKEFRFDTYTATHFTALSKPFFTEEICPDIMIEMLMRFKDKPILISENGIAVEDDRIRIVYIAAMLQAMKQGMNMGADVIGYLHWSLMDNWEWGTYHPTFGLASVDPISYERVLKPSGHFYGDIIKHKQLSQEIIRSYLHELPSQIQK